jgi:xanthine dehydrogenase YagT iron-sulfur-binding subunit
MTSITRRTVLSAGAALAGAVITPPFAPAAAGRQIRQPGKSVVRIWVNGHPRELELDPRTTVLDALREHLLLTGTKKGCDQGQCGACTVHINGERVLSCLTLAVAAEGARVDTIEGVGTPGGPLHPMQQAFIEQDAFQCGFCTPGQIMSAIACVREGHAKNDADIQEYMSGNLCRCGAYPKIVAAIKQARPKLEKI